ncbi:MAG: DUF1611 domain-containing protein [Chthonomonas sp.]|nr:DUF1611 domain-containing protein [Chthonomonas sp.]
MRIDGKPLALFMEGALTDISGKMGFGVLRYSQNPVVCVIDSSYAGQDAKDITGIPRSCPVVATVDEARNLGAEVFLLGIAPSGGQIPADWYPAIDRAWELGMTLVNGLHDLLGPRYPDPKRVWDIRIEPAGLENNQGRARNLPAKRVLFIGTDMAIGKMTASLEMWKEARSRGIKAEFVATGQIGITITGSGVPLDAVRVDFASGAIEREMLRYPDAELILVEGQGSLIHPSSTATLPLIRGSVPTHLVLCHRAGQIALAKMPEVAIPELRGFAKMYEDLAEAQSTFPRPVTVGIALNCGHLDDEAAERAVEELERETGWPVTDPVKHGTSRLLDRI